MTMPSKLTKILALASALLAAALHAPELSFIWGVHPHLFAVLSFLLVAYAAVGISGPSVAPTISAMLGNPGAPKDPVPAAQKKTGAVVLLFALGLSVSSCHMPVPPATSTGIIDCTIAALHDASMSILGDAASALATDNWRSALGDLVAKFGVDEVACAVQAISGSAEKNAAATNDPLEALKADRARQWLGEQKVQIKP